ncbi:NAD(+) synthase [Candidatus Spongiihabitans sp.]|uniref:NAD(+) synthase n=1 Tax=Candidatus Spongiihabitans sp. TaxID=3101308 RepID=UPI003C6FF3D9
MKTEAVISHIVNWLTDYAKKSGACGFVVGVSGGIDSAVTSMLAAKTGLPVLCLEMPIHQAQSQITQARTHIDILEANFSNVSSIRIDLTPIFDGFTNAMPTIENSKNEERFLALANTRARLRMTALYYFAGLNNYLVAGTGNKVEDFGVGFYTKYGDGGVDLSPIADLNKTEVYALGETLGVSEEIRVAKPTDGLWGDGRSDEEQLGASYHELEWAMDYMDYDEAINANNLANNLSGRQREVLKIYRRLHQANQHKMEPIPICEIPGAFR